jgi:hypothetical protein
MEKFKDKLDKYIQKFSELIPVEGQSLIGKTEKQNKSDSAPNKIKIDYKFVGVFIAIYIVVYYIIKYINPEFIQKKEFNKDTHFNEIKIDTLKLIFYSFVSTSIATALLILSIYIINNNN